ncbi:protein kinase superfamily protein [Tasmannia lanceolata]|uniref:protein kinase superfamily protein n=1 Tax=Tasmannia lanceolata TaxID=3420 RepID=UPI004062D7B4
MRHLYRRSSSFRRLFSVSIGRKSIDEEIITKANGSPELKNKGNLEILPPPEPPQKPTWKCFSYEEIFEATKGFDPDNLVGRGGYAEVYKGVLKEGQVIAIKRLTRASSDEQREKEFLTEIGTIGHVRHPNVTALLGCCIDNGLHLIFEFSLHGSVSSLLHDENLVPMAWKIRYKIAIGTARGLNYLHKGCQRRIIHRDIKASNILLTAEFEPQISDFGLAKWLPSQWTHHSVMPIEGTFGYLAPEYFMHGIVDEKTDVFAFGVFLLEIISGRKPVDGSHQSLLSWAQPHLEEEDEVEMLVDERLGEDYDIEQVKRLAFTASLCIRASATWRPSMSEVIELLEDGDKRRDCWKMPEPEEEDDFWGFDDLECGSPYSSTPLHSTTSST